MEKIKNNKGGLIVLLALIILTVVFFATKKPKVLVNDDASNSSDIKDLTGEVAGTDTIIDMPAESDWMEKEVSEDKLTLQIPEQYFVSKPRISGCDVTSISTQLPNGKPVSVALVYNVECENADLKANASQSIEKNGYIFRTNYTSPSVIAVFERIVNSAK